MSITVTVNETEITAALTETGISAAVTSVPITVSVSALDPNSHAALTLGTANGLSLSTQVLSLGLASAGVTGALSGADWSTFNSKQAALGYTPVDIASADYVDLTDGGATTLHSHSGGGGTWGSITGTLSNQTDLQTALDAKQNSLPVVDTQTIVKGSVDATKLLRFEVDGFTTGTTRVLTPPNADITLAGQNFANLFSSAQKINVNSTTALLVEQDGVKDNVLVVDTTNGKIGVGLAAPITALHVQTATSADPGLVVAEGGIVAADIQITGYNSLLALHLTDDENLYHLGYFSAEYGRIANYMYTGNSLFFEQYDVDDTYMSGNGFIGYGGFFFISTSDDNLGIYERSANVIGIGYITNFSTAASNTTPVVSINVATPNVTIAGSLTLANYTSNGILTTSGGNGTVGVTSILAAANGGTGVNNAGTLTNASNTTITGGGTVALGGFTLTVPASLTAAGLGIANLFTAAQSVVVSDAVTNTTSTLLTIGHNSSGTPADSFGTRLLFNLASSTNANREAGSIDVQWTTAADGTRASKMMFNVVWGGGIPAPVLTMMPNSFDLNIPSAGNGDVLLQVADSGSPYFRITKNSSLGHMAVFQQASSDKPVFVLIGGGGATGTLQEWRKSDHTVYLTVQSGGHLQFGEAINIIAGTSTGTKIGTVGGSSGQKFGFFGATPIVQPLLATGAGATVDNVITALQNLGLVRQS